MSRFAKTCFPVLATRGRPAIVHLPLLAVRRVAASSASVGAVFANANLRRLELAWAGSACGSWAYTVALALFAYRAGGAAAVGLVGLLRFLPAAVAAPFLALLADRYPRRYILLAADLGRALAMVAVALAVLLVLPPALVYTLACSNSLLSAAFRPAEAALVPTLAKSEGEVQAANVVASTIDSVAAFAGPALAGLLLATSGASVVFLASAATFLWSASLVKRIGKEPDGAAEPGGRDGRAVGAALAGFRTLAHAAHLRLVLALYAAVCLVFGALGVFTVVTALEVLRLGDGGVGYLTAALGVGGLVGALVALLVEGRALRLAFPLGVVVYGAPLVFLGLWPDEALVPLLLAAVGLANTVVDVAAFTLFQRMVAASVLARVFGVLDGLTVALMALGAVLAPLAIEALGVRGALVAFGLVPPAAVALAWGRVTAIGAPRQALPAASAVTR
jgi:hypothetical protein